jgi:tautomerase-like protein
MPLVRIDLPRGKTADYRKTIGDVVYEAMLQTINVPANDRFQIIAEHAPENLIIDRTYLGIERSPECIVIQGQRTDKRGSVASALSLIPSSATYPAYQSAAGGATPRRAWRNQSIGAELSGRSAQRLVQLR